MRNMLLLCSALAILGCAHNPRSSLPANRPLPEAVTNPPAASAEGSFATGSQISQTLMQDDLQRTLQEFHNDMLKQLMESLLAPKKSPPPTAPVGPSS